MIFKDEVAVWLRQQGARRPGVGVRSVVSIESSAWTNDDTEGCGCNTVEIRVQWEDDAGGRHTEYLEGDGVKSLWDWVVGSEARHAGVIP